MSLVYDVEDGFGCDPIRVVESHSHMTVDPYSGPMMYATPAGSSIGSSVQSNRKLAVQQQTAKSIGSDANQMQTQVQKVVSQRIDEQKKIACNPEEWAKLQNRELNGGPGASKVVCITGLKTLDELNKGTSVTFDRALLEDTFRVHARNSDNRAIRVGEVDQVVVTQMTLLESFSNLPEVPLVVSSPQFGGKINMLPVDTGRAGGRNQRALAVIYPGHSQSSSVIYRKIRADLLQMARITGQFDASSLKEGMTQFKMGTQGQVAWLVPDSHFVSTFVRSHAKEWELTDDNFEKFQQHRLFPGAMIDFVLGLLSKLDEGVRNNKHDLGSLELSLVTMATAGGLSSEYLKPDNEVLFSLTILIEYQFLQPSKLLVSTPPVAPAAGKLLVSTPPVAPAAGEISAKK